DPPVEVLVLEVEDGVRVLDRRGEEPFRVLGYRRAHDLEAGDVREGALGVLRMERPAREAASGGQAHDDRNGRAAAEVLLRRHGDEVIPGAGDEVRELHLGYRPQTHERGSGRPADDGRLGQRRVENAPGAELLLESE